MGFFFAADRAALMTSSSHDANVLSDGKIAAPPDPAAGAAMGSVAWVTSGLLVADGLLDAHRFRIPAGRHATWSQITFPTSG
jgi:hypothetical protein